MKEKAPVPERSGILSEAEGPKGEVPSGTTNIVTRDGACGIPGMCMNDQQPSAVACEKLLIN